MSETLLREILGELKTHSRLLERLLEQFDSDEVVITCPFCGTADEEKIQDTSTMSERRLTCTSCGKSFQPVIPAEE